MKNTTFPGWLDFKTMSNFERATLLTGAVALILGVWGLYTRLFVGEREVGYGSYVVWGLWVAMYLFLAGIATGAYMLAAFEYLFNIRLFKGVGKAALWAGLVTMPAALASIGMDLGHMERIIKVYLQPNFSSLLAQMVWGYTVFMVVVGVTLWLVFQQKDNAPTSPALKAVMWVGVVLAIFLSGGVGALLGVNASRPYWSIGLLSVQFPIYAFASGVSLLMIVVGWFLNFKEVDRQRQLLHWLGWVALGLSFAKIYILWAYLSQGLYSNIPGITAPINEILFGPYWWYFWVLQIGLGTLVPLLIHVTPKLAHDNLWAGLTGLLVLMGFAVARANIVFPALTVEALDGLPEAFFGPHLDIVYYPTLLEWSVTLGVVGGATVVFLLGARFLSIFNTPALEVKS